MNNPKLVLFASYPKTGSTFLPNLIDRWGRNVGGSVAQRFVWGGGKNNFLISNQKTTSLYLVKTHHNIDDFEKKLKKNPEELKWIIESINTANIDLRAGKGYGLIYTMRNPFCVLTSGINYSKLLFARDDVRAKWKKNGLDRKYFVDLLGMKTIPDVDEFKQYSILNLPITQLEDVSWKYVNSMGSIPIFDAGDGMLGYFDHILYYNKIIEKQESCANVTYEGLMSRSLDMLQQIANVLGIDSTELTSAWDDENIDRTNSEGRYGHVFYAGFRTTTPEQFTQIATWDTLLQVTEKACPPLAQTLR